MSWENKSPAPRSSVVIARLLASEGYTDYLANQIERYWMKTSGLSDRQTKKIQRLNKELSRIAKELSEGDKMVLGRFIGLHKKMAFDTGLRMGLIAYLTSLRNGKDDTEEDNTVPL
jgi:hypothetical protein